MTQASFAGVGLGLRTPHLAQAALANPGVPFWEIAPENVLGDGGLQHRLTWEVLGRDPVISHGLGQSVGGFDPFDEAYLEGLVRFLLATGSPWHSEHLCFTTVDGGTTHELLPMPLTKGSARHAIRRARELQARLPVPFLLENITYYAELGASEMPECDWLAEVLEGADVGWLLDVNNVYVNGLNHGFDPIRWLERTPLERVGQIHVAGHQRLDDLVVDTHGAPVIPPVVELLQWVLPRIGHPVPILLERDNEIPPLEVLLEEREALQKACDAALAASPEGEALHA